MEIKKVIKSKLCIGCGICSIDKKTGKSIFSKKYYCYIPSNQNINSNSIANKVCPGKGYNIIDTGRSLFNNNYDIDLGFYDSYIAARSRSDKVLENASSGGVITEILLYLIKNKIVDKVSVTNFIYSCNDGIKTKTYLTSDENEILRSQGSKYSPTNLEFLIDELQTFKGTVAIVATPCAIAGIRSIIKNNPSIISSDIRIFISNFCGGFKSMYNISRLAQLHKIDTNKVTYFRFRGGGQPGSLKFVEENGKEASTPSPKYVGMTGESKMLRCHLCVDATGELADISCGDAWIKRFEQDKRPWSVIISRSSIATELLNKMENKKNILINKISIEEVKESQSFNLKSKKRRQYSRMSLYRKLGYKIPEFDGGFDQEKTSMNTEFQVYLKHNIKLFFEKIKLYPIIYNKIKR